MRRVLLPLAATVVGLALGAAALLGWQGRDHGLAAPVASNGSPASTHATEPVEELMSAPVDNVPAIPEKVPTVPGGTVILAWGLEPLAPGTAGQVHALGVGAATEVRR